MATFTAADPGTPVHESGTPRAFGTGYNAHVLISVVTDPGAGTGVGIDAPLDLEVSSSVGAGVGIGYVVPEMVDAGQGSAAGAGANPSSHVEVFPGAGAGTGTGYSWQAQVFPTCGAAAGEAFGLGGGDADTLTISERMGTARSRAYDARVAVIGTGTTAAGGSTVTTPFVVQREPYGGNLTGGDAARSSSIGLPKVSLRYYQESALAPQDIYDQSSLFATVVSHTAVELTWGWPTSFDGWTYVALVRSAFGHPSTVNDGVTIYARSREDFPTDSSGNPLVIIVKDPDLPGGRWFYYTLFFYNGVEWVAGLTADALVPRNFNHADHLWAAVPPYYKTRDDDTTPGDGPLRRFLRIVGFEMDQTREYSESYQETYHADTSPVALLKHVGENLGLEYEHGLGEIRYRSLLSHLYELQDQRGTVSGLKQLVELSSKCETVVTPGINMLRLPDDAEFVTGTGNWGALDSTLQAGHRVSGSTYGTGRGQAFDATTTSVSTSHTWYARAAEARSTMFAPQLKSTVGSVTQVIVPVPDTPVSYANTGGAAGVGFNPTIFTQSVANGDHALDVSMTVLTTGLKEGVGRQGMFVNSSSQEARLDLIVSCGATADVNPRYGGVAVREGLVYGFRIWYKGAPGVIPYPGIHWSNRHGEIIGAVNGASSAWDDDWYALDVQAEAPDGVVFANPFVRLKNRPDGAPVGMSLMGALFYEVGPSVSVTVYAPEITFVMGDSLLGAYGVGHETQKLMGV